ncbi:MAG TPA: type IV secretory system conjugative DNA transfer family protein, partial [Nitrososphaera sp.]|nr:type IV secretory system conjugative DNA transfer family protein [Nitrososphaera sp.]
DIAAKASGDQGLENYAPYVTNKFDAFTTNEIVRPIIAQQKSAFNFRDLMDNRKILLVNLAKGRIGDLNANLLGLVIVGKFLLAALSRADSFGKDLPPFYLHIDEFQNFATPSIATIFSEARKYKLSLTVAHQFIAQLTDEIKDAVFGNVGSICAFRVGADDGEFLEKQFAPVFTAGDLIRVDNYQAHLKLLIGGKPAQPFNIETIAFKGGTMEHVAQMQELSALRYGRPRAEVEAEVTRGLAAVSQEPSTLAKSGV